MIVIMSTEMGPTNSARSVHSGRPTIKEVARLAGVSPSTVSHAISGRRTISEETKARVFAAIDELGYGADPIASSLRRGKTQLIGLVLRPKDAVKGSLGGTDNFLHLIGAAATAALDKGWGLVHIPNSVDTCDTTLPVDGYIVAHPYANDPILKALRRTRRPVVTIDAVADDIEQGANIKIDYERGFEHLLGKFDPATSDTTALIAGTEDNQWNRAALDCVVAWAGGSERLHSITKLYEGEGTEGARALAKQVLQDGATRIVTAASRFAVGVCQAAASLQLSVPGNVQVASLTDSSLASMHRPGITAVDIRLDRAGAASVGLIVDLLQGHESVIPDAFVPEVHWRDSA